MSNAPSPHEDDAGFCRAMLPAVSRTFALTIRLLPPDLEYPVLVAYLLCRIADTIEDSTRLQPARKARLLETFRGELVQGRERSGLVREAFTDHPTDDERLAFENERVLREFFRLPAAQQDAIRPWVQEMCEGMARFATQHEERAGGGPAILTDVAELERYCYYVAGTVGHLLTALFILHDGRMEPERKDSLGRLATSFGLGLQLTNIIKDVSDDRRRGVSYIPRELYEKAGDRGPAVVIGPLIVKARGHLNDALEYCTHLPRRQYRMRLFCLTSLYFAIRTLRLAELQPALLDSSRKLKISRGAVYRTLIMSYLVAPVNSWVRAYFDRLSAAGA